MLNLGMNLQRLAAKQVEFTPASLFNNGEAGVWYDPSAASGSLGWRRNLLEYTESFDNSYWVKTNSSITPNGATAPNGTATADKLTENSSANSVHNAYQVGVTVVQGADYTFSIYVKKDDYKWVQLSFALSSGTFTANDWANFDVNAGVVGNVGSGASGAIQDVGDGWYKCSVTAPASASASSGATICLTDNTNASSRNPSYTGDGSSGIYIWGAQLEEASTASSYQPILSTFANAFKDAFPSHTLYQDYLGVTPVTAVGQPVGLMLDKSEGLAQGSELVVNGDFATDSGWSNQAGWTIGGGVASVNSSAAGSTYIRQGSTVIGRMYQITFEVTSFTSGALYATAGSAASGGPITSTGVYTRLALANTTQGFGVYASGSTAIASIDNISVVEVAGSHATQPTSTKRPIYARHPEGGIRNLLNYTEQFDNGYWTKGGNTSVSAGEVDPNGGSTAFKYNISAPTGRNIDTPDNVITGGKAYTFSLYVKAITNTTIRLRQSGNIAFDKDVSITTAQGWQRISFTFTSNSGTRVGFYDISGSTGDRFYMWGAQLEEATEASNYQKVVTDIDVTESGVGEVYYLKFDGVDDGMQINNLTSGNTPLTALFGYSATNVTVRAKFLLDIQSGRTIFAPSADTAGYLGYYSGGWSEFNADAAAIKVLTYDLAEDDAKIRIDGTQEYSDTTYDQRAIGGDIALFSRYDASGLNYLAGNMYQTILRAAESTDEEIAKAETYVANKTGLKAQVDGIATLDLNFGNNTYTAKNSNGGVI